MATPIEAVSTMIRRSGKSRRQISLELGLHENSITTLVQKGNVPKTEKLAEIAAACGYQLQLVGHGETIVIDPPTRG